MRHIYIALSALIAAVIVTFMVQNVRVVTVSFLTASLSLPLSMIIVGAYLLGILTGGMVISSIRSLAQRTKKSTD